LQNVKQHDKEGSILFAVSQKTKQHSKEGSSIFAMSQKAKRHDKEGRSLFAMSENIKEHDKVDCLGFGPGPLRTQNLRSRASWTSPAWQVQVQYCIGLDLGAGPGSDLNRPS
jgi:hypothetical protein